ncbi:hypothetical protein D9611_001500 [Ephemerocybe angulata]|uniref:Uncharacterized protein n=1 Tax=Ephemerocybe angulata TaxID=980116 RepID=A0A8H5CKF7_9AGAR|nr:hypothetical protein D9611_001500 [Tulosesus angulatus]
MGPQHTPPASMPKQSRYPVYLPPPPSSSSAPSSSSRKTQSLAPRRITPRPILPSAPLRSPPLASERTPLLASPPKPHRRQRPLHVTTAPAALLPQIPPRHTDVLLPKPGQSSRQPMEHALRRSSGPLPHTAQPQTPPRPRPTPKPAPAPAEAKKKPFYRPRPLWLVPFAIVAALVRGMTLAPRVEVYTQLACYSLYAPQPSPPPINLPSSRDVVQWTPSSVISLFSSLDPLGPHLFPAPQIQRDRLPRDNANSSSPTTPILLSSPLDDEALAQQDPRNLPSHRCLTDPAVQASAARLQTLMTTTMGLLSALTTTFWGRFSQTHGRTKVLAISTFGLLFTDLIFILTSTPNLPWPLSVFDYTPDSPDTSNWARYKHHLLLLGPIVEGALGGWTTLQSATSAYISDCTSVGSRAGVFSRFTGVFYAGFSVGPMIAGYIVRHPELFNWPGASAPSSSKHHRKTHIKALLDSIVGVNATKQRPVQSVTAVFWVAILCSFVNFLLVLFVFPESLDKEKQKAAAAALAAHADPKGKARASEEDEAALLSPGLQIVEDVEGVGGGDGFVDVEELQSPIHSSSSSSQPFTSSEPTAPSQPPTLVSTLLRPLSIFRPVPIVLPTRNGLLLRTKYDWSLTLLALSLGGWMLSTGVYQIKYLYAEHVYGWGAEELSVYISWMGAVRAAVLLWGVPGLVGWLKGRAAEREREREANAADRRSLWDADKKGKQRRVEQDEDGDVEANEGRAAKPPLSRLTLGKSIQFDLRLARLSLFVDLLSNILITVTPSPSFHASSLRYYMDSRFGAGASAVTVVPGGGGPMSHGQSQAMFVAASSLSALGGGLVPAVHSLALCIVQVRALEPEYGVSGYGARDSSVDTAIVGYGSVVSSTRASSVASSSGENGPAAQASPAVDSGSLFGAFAVLQALGQMILGPMLFGLVYSSTVAGYPKTVFVLSTALLFLSMLLLLCVRNPVGEVRLEKRDRKFRERIGSAPVGVKSLSLVTKGQVGGAEVKVDLKAMQKRVMEERMRRWEADIGRRGRSVREKDLRGGAVPLGVAVQRGGLERGVVGMGVSRSEGQRGGSKEVLEGVSLSYREERMRVTMSA